MAKKITITVPDIVLTGTKKDAKMLGRSLNAYVVDIMKEALGFDPKQTLAKQIARATDH